MTDVGWSPDAPGSRRDFERERSEEARRFVRNQRFMALSVPLLIVGLVGVVLHNPLLTLVPLVTSVVVLCGSVCLIAKEAKETPQTSVERRIRQLNSALGASVRSLGDASELIVELQQEIASRQTILEELNEKQAQGEKLAQISVEATHALNAMIEAKMLRTEKHIGRLAWWQGGVDALVGAAVALMVTAYADAVVHWFR